ncbi:lamin-B1 isoform X2 [Corythoichthys intestinalis]|uniref:lamin-B1 isoform X2 n=1 Tax=Corythoichthys intestinalis TaxID=161448 RepID=UPI0025A65939|nr:lamin-B1 isoform X2 [Corythoichthys intestinalis]XP_061800594.1 lamin-B1-like [Nerophis lumbriciformis]
MTSLTASPTCQRSTCRGNVPPGSKRITRLQEKQQLRNLNDRLAVYIDTVRNVESEKDKINLEMTQIEVAKTRQLCKKIDAYETELADARKSLDDSSMNRAWLQIELGKLKSEHKELLQSYDKREAEVVEANTRLKDLEAELITKEGLLTKSSTEKSNLEANIAELQREISELNSLLAQTKEELANVTLFRVDLENRHQSLKEEMEFRKTLHQEEVKEACQRYETHLVVVESEHKEEYESKLSLALAEMRVQNEEQMRIYKESMENTYTAKMDNARRLSEMNGNSASIAREELRESTLRVVSLTAQLEGLQKEARGWRDRVTELEEALAKEKDARRKLLFEKDSEVAQIQKKMEQQLNEYEQLLDVKCALDMEINAYRKLIEGEEERLKLCHSHSSRGDMSSVSSSSRSVHTTQGKRKRIFVEEQEASSSVSIALFASSATGPIVIDEIDTDGKFISLQNTGEKDQAMVGWEVIKAIGNVTATFKFTPRYNLKAGQKVTIWMSDTGMSSKPPTDLIWRDQFSWRSGEKVHVVLINAKGEEVAKRKTADEENVEEFSAIDEKFIKDDLSKENDAPHSGQKICSIM